MKNFKNIIAAIILTTTLAFSTAFASDGIIIEGMSEPTGEVHPCVETGWGGIIIEGFAGMIGIAGIIIEGASDSECGIIIEG